MLFSSITFLYYFLITLLIIYFLVPRKFRNPVLLSFSLIFYFLGEPKYILVIVLSCILNYIFGILVTKKHKKLFLVLSIVYNVSQLLVFKYTDFFIQNINTIFKTNLNLLHIAMPIGISFFTFQVLSYVIDVYNKNTQRSNNFFDFMTYICLFPQLVAGPIVRYSDINEQLTNRNTSYGKFSGGVKRFIIGLSKKVLLANTLGEALLKLTETTLIASWLRPITFTLQIYFDFSGYSDMAIGLGLMFGFNFPENFNYPLISSSITEFWHRWHITLSSWFRDYVYIPLGGNRVSTYKWIRNIFIVWFLTGFWHGASWNFIVWGLYFGTILVIEKLFLGKYIEKTKIFKHVYSLLVIIISFLIFNSPNLQATIVEIKNMFLINNIAISSKETIFHLRDNFTLLIISIVCATPLLREIIAKLKTTKLKKAINFLEPITYIILLTLVTAFLVDSSFNPFLYFRF